MTNHEIDSFAIFDSLFRGPSNEPLPRGKATKLKQHVADLAAAHEISWSERDIHVLDADGCFSPEKRELVVPVIASELSYFVAVHEVGHIALQLPSFEERPDGEKHHRLYRNEATVWEWSLDEALIAPSEDAVEKFVVFLSSHDPGEGQAEAIKRLREKCVEVQQAAGVVRSPDG